MLKFNIRHQSISRVDHFRPVEKSVKYLKARFFFLTDEWDEYEKRCLCRRDGQTYEKSIIDGECEIPWEVLLGGPFELCVVGKNGDTIVPTAAVEIDLGITLPGGPEGAEPTPSQYDELNKRIDALAGTAVLHTEQSLSDEQREQARKNIGAADSDDCLVKALPVYKTDAYNRIYVNLEELETRIFYTTPLEYTGRTVRFTIVCEDGTEKVVWGGSLDNLVHVSVINNSNVHFIQLFPSGKNTAYHVTLTDKSTADAVKVTQQSNKAYLNINNTIEYMPRSDYNPATKKYVDDAVALKADKFDPIEVLIEEDMLPAVHENGAILTDENGNVILRY